MVMLKNTNCPYNLHDRMTDKNNFIVVSLKNPISLINSLENHQDFITTYSSPTTGMFQVDTVKFGASHDRERLSVQL